MTTGTPKFVASLISASGGRIVGRTRLQKMVCLLSLSGRDVGFDFSYHHYGPYSEELSFAASDARVLGLVHEKECYTDWGTRYSVFESNLGDVGTQLADASPLLILMRDADSVELELAVTAAFLKADGVDYPWEEVRRRKSQKATPVRMQAAKKLYSQMQEANTGRPLPAF